MTTIRDIVVRPISTAVFAPFGRLIEPAPDGAPITETTLDLSQGRPRFYIMQLRHRGLEFARITRHRAVTQVLASASARPWMLGVAPPGAMDEPALDDIAGFSIPGGVAVQLHRGAWHAGPYFADPAMAFFNLELDDTNETDHQDCDLDARYGVRLRLMTP